MVIVGNCAIPAVDDVNGETDRVLPVKQKLGTPGANGGGSGNCDKIPLESVVAYTRTSVGDTLMVT